MIIQKNLEKIKDDSYILIKQKENNGCLLIIFAKEKFKDRITKVSYDTVKFGLLANRGAILIKLFIDDSSFCFINCLLEPGPKNSNNRISNINDIHKRAFQTEGVGKLKVIIRILFYLFKWQLNLIFSFIFLF